MRWTVRATRAAVVAAIMGLTVLAGASRASAQSTRVLDVRVQDRSEAGLPGALVTVRTEAGQWSAVTDELGQVRIGAVPASALDIVVSRDGFRTWSGRVEAGSSAQTVTATIDLLVREEVAVVAPGRYGAAVSETATRMPVASLDVPQSVQVIPRTVIEDQQRLRPSDAVRNVSGVVPEAGNSGTLDGFFVRGFTVYTVLKNGWRRQRVGGLTELSNVESIEVLKGPSSVLFGQAEPGGTVNVVTKTALPVRQGAVSVTGGLPDLGRVTLDVSTPVGSPAVALRLNAAVERNEGFRDFTSGNRTIVAPSLRVTFGARTHLTVDGEYLRQDRPFVGSGGIVVANRIIGFPIEQNLSGGRDSRLVTDWAIHAALEHRLASAWKVRVSGQTLDTSSDGRQVYFTSAPADGRNIPRTAYRSVDSAGQWFGRADVLGQAQTGAISHQFMAGAEAGRQTYALDSYRATTTIVDALNPARLAAFPGVNFQFVYDERYRFQALYAQDLVSFGPRWSALLGVRHDWSQIEGGLGSAPDRSDLEWDPAEKTRATSPRVGLVFKPRTSVSLFAGYSQSFQPTSGIAENGDRFKPQLGEQVEGGIKVERRDGRLAGTVSVYRLNRTNMLLRNPANPAFRIQIGEQGSRGLEIDLTATPVRGFDVMAAFTSMTAKVLHDTTIPVGTPLQNIPKQSVSVWAQYRVPDGQWRGVYLAGGVYGAAGKRGQLSATSFELPSYAIGDVAAGYTWKRWTLSLNVQNVADRRYFESAQGVTSLYYGQPRTTLLRLTTAF